jgi:tetratricopeptide (TPR) repeat protein
LNELGSYRLLDQIGSGGMGTVHRAEAPDGTVVALKVIHRHLVGKEGYRERFAREVDIGRRIRDPNVVATLDAGEVEVDGDPTLFLAMEFVEGQTLRELLDELGMVPEDLCLHIGREVARALDAIHAAGVFHRDIKPENVLITADSRIKVMDLGVALIADESLRLSQSGVFAGSVLYAAPEQFAELPADGRADLYNVGLLLYELATGQHPFQADDIATVIQKQMSADPRPPAELNPQLSPFFEEVVLRLIDKDRDCRFARANDLLSVLEEKERSDWWRGRARELRALAAEPLRRIRIPRETPIEGRDEELEQLAQLFEAVRAGAGRVLLVEGEAGIGKTRLVDEFTDRLAKQGESFHFLFGSYPPGGAATASGALSTAYREFFGTEGLEERLESCLNEAPGLVPAFAALLRGAPPPAGAAPLSRDALLHAFTLVTSALAAERPTVVLIEDLHFAPEMGRAIFASLATALVDQRVLLIGTMRPDLPDAWTGDIERLNHASRIAMRRLTPKELSRLLVELFHSERLAGELGWAIATKSDGNPFFVFELVRALREDRLIAREPDGTWVKTGLIQELHVPSSVLDLVEARIRDLDETDKDLLEVASCCGFEFDPLLVAAALELDQIPAMKRFAHLEKKHRLVRAVGRRYVFDHHQVQEALYRGLPELLREPYHAKLGRALEQRYPESERQGAVGVDLCEHFLSGAQGKQALRYLPGALAHLRDGYLHDEAIELAQRALGMDGLLTGAQRVEVLLGTAASLELRGRHKEDAAVLDEAMALADADGDSALRASVRIHRGRLCIWTSEYDAAHGWLTEARDLARDVGDEVRANQAIGNLGVVYFRVRRLEEARELFRSVLEHARDNENKRGMAIATLNLGNIHWCRGEFEDARAHYERYRDLSREIGYREGEALAAGNLGNVFVSLGRLATARVHYEEVLSLAAAIGDRHKLALFEESLGQVDLVLGRPERAKDHIERALAVAREVGMPREVASALLGLADMAAETGEPGHARELAREARALYRELGEMECEAGVRLTLARLARDAGNEAEAISQLDAAVECSRAANDESHEVLCVAARAGLAGGDVDQAVRLFEERRAKMSMPIRMRAAFLLFQATGDPAHLSDARALLATMRQHAPPEDRATMCEHCRLHREILAESE